MKVSACGSSILICQNIGGRLDLSESNCIYDQDALVYVSYLGDLENPPDHNLQANFKAF